MNKIEKFILESCAYTVLICLMFLLFAQISGFTTATLSFVRFLTLIIFGAIIAGANAIWTLNDWHYMLRLFIHYISLLAAFFVVFVLSGNIKANGGAAVFVAIFIFTFLYALIFTLTYFAKKALCKADAKLTRKPDKASTSKGVYSPRFRG